MIDKLIENAPIVVIFIYYLLLVIVLLSKQFRSEFLDSHKETSLNSWTRFLGTFVVTSSIIIALSQVVGKGEVNTTLITTMLVIAFGGKVIQKNVENKNNDKPKG